MMDDTLLRCVPYLQGTLLSGVSVFQTESVNENIESANGVSFPEEREGFESFVVTGM